MLNMFSILKDGRFMKDLVKITAKLHCALWTESNNTELVCFFTLISVQVLFFYNIDVDWCNDGV